LYQRRPNPTAQQRLHGTEVIPFEKIAIRSTIEVRSHFLTPLRLSISPVFVRSSAFRHNCSPVADQSRNYEQSVRFRKNRRATFAPIQAATVVIRPRGKSFSSHARLGRCLQDEWQTAANIAGLNAESAEFLR
jgi:hypothetical protein